MRLIKFAIKKLWLYESLFSEAWHALARDKAQRYYDRFLPVLRREYASVEPLLAGAGIDRVIVVGSGIFPFSCLFYKDKFEWTMGIDRGHWICRAARLVGRKYFDKQLRIIHREASAYKEWDNALVIVSLLTEGKQEVVADILSRANNIVIVRDPGRRFKGRYESLAAGRSQFKDTVCPGGCYDSYVFDNRSLLRQEAAHAHL